jgi:hypothetical protein
MGSEAALSKRFLLVVIATTLNLCGCAYHLKTVATEHLNKGLPYIVWPDPDADKPAAITLQPGMTLVVDYVPLLPKWQQGTPGSMMSVPPISEYQWTVPPHPSLATDYYSQRDMFFIGYLFVASSLSETSDESQIVGSINTDCPGIEKNCLPGTTFSPQASKALAIKDITFFPANFRPYPQTSTASAAWLRASFDMPSELDFKSAKNPGQRLEVQFDDKDRKLTLFDCTPAYFVSDATPTKRRSNNPWYERDVDVNNKIKDRVVPCQRSYLQVQMPVRIQQELTSRHLPVYWSISDLENRLGVEILGVRRRSSYSTTLSETDCTDAKCKLVLIKAKDDYFTIWFGKGRGAVGAKKSVALDLSEKEKLILAAGDVVILAKRRLKVTDLPEQR